MSIFKQSFPFWIKDQLKVRQDAQFSGVGSNNSKSNDALVWQQSRQCVIKAISLVDYKEDVGLELVNDSFSQLKGPELSKRFILQGGIPRNSLNQVFGREGSAYGDPLIASDAHADGYGIVPMPGITNFEIKTKSAYGSLRQAKLNFVVHNLRQLEIMEMLYMRPGYPVIVEWGWAPYLDNEGNIVEHPDTLNTIVDSTTGVKDYLFTNNIDQDAIYSAIIKLKKSSYGNVDAFMGFVTNFGYKARSDGGFDCYSEIISMGEALDSIKISSIKSILGSEFGELDIEFAIEESEEEIKNPDALKAILLVLGLFTNVISSQGAEKDWYPQWLEFSDNSSDLIKIIINRIKTKFEPISSYPENERDEALLQFILRKYQTISAGEFDNPINTGYVRWDLLVFLINEFVIPKVSSGKPSVQITTHKWINDPKKNKKIFTNLKYTSIDNINDNIQQFIGPKSGPLTDLSCDPGVCILPHSWFDESLQKTIGAESLGGKILEGTLNRLTAIFNSAVNEAQSWSIGRWLGSDAVDIDDYSTVEFKQSINEKLIGNIFLNTDMLLEVYSSTISSNQTNADLGSFIKGVWDKVNEACPLHNFIFKIDDEFSNNAYVIDLPIDNSEIAEIKDDIFIVEVQSNKSVVREYNLEAKIPDALKATVAVHAQSPTTAQDIDDVTFQAFNRAIKNRLFYPSSEETEEEKQKRLEQEKLEASQPTPEEVLIKEYENQYKSYLKYKKVYFQIINYLKSRVVDDTDDRISDLKTTLRSLHTSINQLQSLSLKKINTGAVIPLEFNLTFDGISNILIGCIFKIKEDRLPRAYRKNAKGGANVGFIVFNEEQSVTAGQDWTTKIGGKMIILPSESSGERLNTGGGQGTGAGKGAGTRPVDGNETLTENNTHYTDDIGNLELENVEDTTIIDISEELEAQSDETSESIAEEEAETVSVIEDIDDPNPEEPEIITDTPIEEEIIEDPIEEETSEVEITKEEALEQLGQYEGQYRIISWKIGIIKNDINDIQAGGFGGPGSDTATAVFNEQAKLYAELNEWADGFERLVPVLEYYWGPDWDTNEASLRIGVPINESKYFPDSQYTYPVGSLRRDWADRYDQQGVYGSFRGITQKFVLAQTRYGTNYGVSIFNFKVTKDSAFNARLGNVITVE